jgi:polar amino acid transport system substrate-binding protein
MARAGIAVACIGILFLASCATGPTLTSQAQSELAPMGKIRVAINFGNRNFARKDAAGAPSGMAVDLARELGERTGIPVELVAYESAARLTGAATSGAWDVAFLAYERARENDITFPAAFAEVDATYLVPPGSPLRNISEVDREGVRIAVSAKGGNELFLSRTIKQAKLVRVVTSPTNTSFGVFVAEKLDAYAGLKPTLIEDSAKLPGSRVLDGRYTVIQYSIGIVKGRDAGAAYLRDFIDDVKASGLMAKLLEKNGVQGLSVAPRVR